MVDQTQERTRGAVAVIIAIALAIAAVGVYAGSKPPGTAAYLRPDHAIVFYAVALAVLIVGLLVVLAASSGKQDPEGA